MNSFPILHTDRLDLIEIKHVHSGDIFKLFGDEEVIKFYNIVQLKSEQDSHTYIDNFQNRLLQNLGIRWGIAFKGEQNIIGTLGFNNYTKNHKANIGYDLQKAYWNNGYITEALKCIIEFGFEKLEVNRIDAEVMQGNVNSEKVLEKLNFKKEGILREWLFWNGKHYDMSMFSRLKSEF